MLLAGLDIRARYMSEFASLPYMVVLNQPPRDPATLLRFSKIIGHFNFFQKPSHVTTGDTITLRHGICAIKADLYPLIPPCR